MAKNCILYLLCSTLLFCLMASTAHTNGLARVPAATCSPSDLVALRSFAASFPAANFSNWGASDDCCTWGASITCASFPSTTNNNSSKWRPVTRLFLDYAILYNYPIPLSLCNLSSLTSLHIAYAGLSGSIPSCIGTHLTNLVELDLSWNGLTGHIPHSFSHLKSLHSLDLSYNSLTGPLPHSLISHLQSLHSLLLTHNDLSGQPFSFAQLIVLPNLTILDLSVNAFYGPIPSFNTPLLQELRLSYNSFSGSIDSLLMLPPSTLSSLLVLDLSTNSLSGEIPTFHPSAFPALAYLTLDNNLFSGTLPDSICGLKNLTSLLLSSNSFSGSLLLSAHCRKPKFTHLSRLEIAQNQFVGPFPEWVGSISNLSSLDLSYNSFSGILPSSWQNLSLLGSLRLSGNSLAAPNPSAPKLPSWFFTLPSLEEVFLSSVGIQATDLHCSSLLLFLKRAGYISQLDLSMNNVNSDVLLCLSNYSAYSAGLFNLSGNRLALNLNLEESIQLLPQAFSELYMSSCELRGSLSGSFFDRIAASVQYLSLAHNYLEGQVPAQLGNLTQLAALDLSHNYFTGVAPLNRKLSEVYDIQLSHNHLVGKLSSLLLNFLNISACYQIYEGTLMQIGNLDVSNNFLTGYFPPSLGDCFSETDPSRLRLNNNRLSLIPNTLFENRSVDLQILSLSNNHLTGQVPSSFRDLGGLELLDLSHNRLTGSLETGILSSNASSNQYYLLRVLLLGYNDFSGSVPPSLEVTAPALQLIDLSNNHLTGMIPMHSLQSLSAFRIINTLSNPNIFAGSRNLYEEIRINMKGNEQRYQYVIAALTLLDLSANNLSGPIFTGLGELFGLVSLNLSRNRLSGLIPSDLGKLVWQLQSLDLSYNELVGPIPPSFQNLTNLEVFNVSYNPGLHGPIPQSQPQFETAESYIGDPNLCGAPILHSCTNTAHETPSDISVMGRKSNKFADWIDEWIAIPGLCLGIVVGHLGTLYALARMYPR